MWSVQMGRLQWYENHFIRFLYCDMWPFSSGLKSICRLKHIILAYLTKRQVKAAHGPYTRTVILYMAAALNPRAADRHLKRRKKDFQRIFNLRTDDFFYIRKSATGIKSITSISSIFLDPAIFMSSLSASSSGLLLSSINITRSVLLKLALLLSMPSYRMNCIRPQPLL